jgi:Kef-type K+ transport system membrane component KefB
MSRLLERIRTTGALGVLALAFALLLASAAAMGGSAMIIGAFAAGVILHPTPQRQVIERSATQLGYFFVPIFFVSVGAAVDLRSLMTLDALLIGLGLIVVGIGGKVLAGLSPWWFKGNRALVGVAMIPRGEVGLIFAQLGLASGVLVGPLFGALMLMVFVTTFVTPPLLGLIAKKAAVPDEGPDESGIDDLVVGLKRRAPH